jgi:plasmid stabilization system protein ParE
VNVVLREEALADLRGIRDWYFERNPAVARTMIARVRDRLAQLVNYRVGIARLEVLGVFHATREPSVRNRP